VSPAAPGDRRFWPRLRLLPTRAMGSQSRKAVPVLAMVVVLTALPVLFRSPYALSNLTLIGIYTLVTLGLCLLTGYAGQASLGQAGFLALGAYGSAVLTARAGAPPLLAAAVAAAVTAGAAALVGVPVLKLRGHYLAMGTLALGVVVNIGLREWRGVTGGPSGLAGITSLSLLGLSVRGDLAYYAAVWVVTAAAVVLSLNVVDSRFGRSLRAIRASEAAAESVGVDVGRAKLLVFVLAAVYASVAGSLYAHYMTFISPSAFDLNTSVRLVLMAAVGGLASIWGAPFGAATVVLLSLGLREAADAWFPNVGGEYQSIAYGVLLVVIMVFMQDGVTVSGVAAVKRAWRQGSGRLRRAGLRRWVNSRWGRRRG